SPATSPTCWRPWRSNCCRTDWQSVLATRPDERHVLARGQERTDYQSVPPRRPIMSRTLEQVKEQIRSRFLGHGGIHGVGLSLKQKAIRLYVDPKRTAECAGALEQVRQSAEPFDVIVVEEEPPSVAPEKQDR